MDPFIPKRRGTPNLDRRLAKKNIDYMSSTFSSSDAAPPPSSLRTRSLDISPLGNKTSFRIQGIDGEFDEICSSLGLCGPEDFSIAATAWEARKGPSALDRSWFPFIDGVRSDDVRSNLKMAAPVSNQKILNDDETVDGGLMAPLQLVTCRLNYDRSDVLNAVRFSQSWQTFPCRGVEDATQFSKLPHQRSLIITRMLKVKWIKAWELFGSEENGDVNFSDEVASTELNHLGSEESLLELIVKWMKIRIVWNKKLFHATEK
ncbi:hypothetical protein RHSIM_Rhsim05G0038100 [Rhododendron simsii]|uniref:Uncharacterized protein n=1 Tax=Rhododendron simsii TaxID=118357 RepID=A0A834GYW7_RHOSS|nr:hypothetical protein RHSIM_Rhsim05G0038100 [Rhododendron simsii]